MLRVVRPPFSLGSSCGHFQENTWWHNNVKNKERHAACSKIKPSQQAWETQFTNTNCDFHFCSKPAKNGCRGQRTFLSFFPVMPCHLMLSTNPEHEGEAQPQHLREITLKAAGPGCSCVCKQARDSGFEHCKKEKVTFCLFVYWDRSHVGQASLELDIYPMLTLSS